MTTLKVLTVARMKIQRGWCQGTYTKAPNFYCLVASIGDQFAPYEPSQRSRNLLRMVTGCESLPDWNDAPERTKTEVLAALDKAIEFAKLNP
ncbi:MAG: hypothetical protein NVSMB58_35400 [Terriglobales bacterium]